MLRFIVLANFKQSVDCFLSQKLILFHLFILSATDLSDVNSP